MPTGLENPTLPRYSHELDWPDGLAPYRIIDEEGTQGEPYAHYAWMRKNAPVLRVRHDGGDVWMVARHEDVRRAMRKPKVFRSQVNDEQPLAFLTLIDAPDHTRLRKVVSAAFTPKAIAAVEDRVREVAADKLDELIASGGGEVVENYARPLTMATISGILDVPIDDLAKVELWSDKMFVYFARLSRSAPGDDDDEAYTLQFFDYLRDNLLRLYDIRSESVGGHIARMWKDDGLLSEKEATELCGFIFVSGFETTMRLIGGGFRELSYNPDLLGRLRENPGDAERFVEELVRMRGPVHRAVRRTTEVTEIAGVTIPADSIVRLLIASANRDDTVWSHADTFDIDRDTEGHFGFGYGVHSCLGAPLARLETRVTAELLGQKVRSVSFDEPNDLVFLKGNSMTTGPETLRVDLIAQS
ncbi:cytochrome P450 [Rhodococcus sp. T7]|uniref:cytochrome P450 n=1 Tax=Rhodococcus sp. T7 TaxID=627444 RepID=UPI0013584057|nr:cytochrome P450 [Rhodococcus sp. T7]KAF0960330.1 Vitamin D(3) 25-hydroxylase [Rhodococcus sp. T7]